MISKKLVKAIALALICSKASAQTIKPKYYKDANTGKLYWNKKLPVYIWVSTTPDKAEQLLTKSTNEQYSVPFYLDTEGVNYIRSKNAIDPVTKEPAKPLQEVMLEIYADGVAPETGATLYNGFSKYVSKLGKTYFGPFVNFSIQATDKTSGVESVFYSVNEGPFEIYKGEQKLSKQGNYVLKYFSSDRVGNVGKVQSQEFIVDNTSPETKLTINGYADDKVVSFSSKMYLTMGDSISGLKQTLYKFDNGKFVAYNGGTIPFTNLTEGKHTLTFYSTDNVNNYEKEQSVEFFLDKSSPLMAADILGDRFLANNIIYFSGRTKLKLTAIDNKVGVKEIKYAIDDQPFTSYSNPFYLPSVSGIHEIKYYSVDKLNNKTNGITEKGYEEFKHNVSKVYVDLTGPILNHEIIGDKVIRKDTLLLGPNNFIKLLANDPESGLQKVTYSFDKELIESDYLSPIKMTKSGFHTLEYFGYDNVNNRNIKSFFFLSDVEGPELFHFFTVGSISRKQGLEVYPSSVGFTLAGTDTLAGLKSIYYSINGQAQKLYSSTITGFKPNTKYTIKFTGTDYLGNQASKEVSFQTGK